MDLLVKIILHIKCLLCNFYLHTYINYVDRPLVEITSVTGGCRHVNISWTTTYNTDDCNVLYYDVTLSFVTMDDHVTVSLVTTMNLSTITGLPDDTQVNITVTAVGVLQDILSVCSASVRTVAFESMSIYTS